MPDSFSPGIGFVLELEKLELLLLYISHDAHRWEIVTDDADESTDGQSVVILYSNPSGIDLPNQIGFRFPCLTENNLFFSVRLVCLHPSLKELTSPRLHCFGHIHGGYGMLEQDGVLFVNAALLGPLGDRQSMHLKTAASRG